MINFFRKIRKQLADDNKPQKYARYAFGEIVLVVVGILIALSINNWNETRKNNILKQSYIKNLKIDLNKDIEKLELLIKLNNGYEKNGFYLLDYMENKLNKIDTLILTRSIIECGFTPQFTTSSATYNDIITSNNIDLFKDIELKRLLDNYYIPSEWQALFQNRILKTTWYDYRDELLKYHSPLLYKDFYENFIRKQSLDLRNDLITLDDYTKYRIEWDNIKTNKYLKKQVGMILAFRTGIRGLLERKLTRARSIQSYFEMN